MVLISFSICKIHIPTLKENYLILLSLEHLTEICSIQGEDGPWNILVRYPLLKKRAVPGTRWYDFLYPRKGQFLEHLGMNCSILLSLEHLIFSIQGEVGPWNILV